MERQRYLPGFEQVETEHQIREIMGLMQELAELKQEIANRVNRFCRSYGDSWDQMALRGQVDEVWICGADWLNRFRWCLERMTKKEKD